jgi:hypothetical protein
MKTAFKILAATLTLSSFIFIGCKKGETGPKGDQGAAGPAGPVINMTSGGFITGTITGTRKDGVPFSEPFNYTYYFPGMGGSGTLDSSGTNSYNFSLQRQEADIFSNNYCSINVNTTSKTASTGTLNLNMTFEKTLSSTKYFSFNGSVGSVPVTSLSYNASTGVFSGSLNIIINGFSNSTTNTATLTGSFQAATIQKVQLVRQTDAIKAD